MFRCEERRRSADGIPVYFEVEGAGAPALVFVHGWSCDRSYWRGQIGHWLVGHSMGGDVIVAAALSLREA